VVAEHTTNRPGLTASFPSLCACAAEARLFCPLPLGVSTCAVVCCAVLQVSLLMSALVSALGPSTPLIRLGRCSTLMVRVQYSLPALGPIRTPALEFVRAARAVIDNRRSAQEGASQIPHSTHQSMRVCGACGGRHAVFLCA
jgi:hypothetical protein